MKINIFFVLLLIIACQSREKDEQASTTAEKINNIQIQETDKHDSPPINGINIKQSSWDLVRAAFQKIDSFPIKCSIFPLQEIIIKNDTLKIDGDICYSFPLEIATAFVKKHVPQSDTLAIWFEENNYAIGKGTDFERGIYPFGVFEYSSKDYYIYYTLNDLTGRGSYDISFYIATVVNQQWESTCFGEQSYSKFNKYEFIDGEEFLKDRMVGEQNLILQLQENKLVITHYSGVHVVGDEFDVFEKGEVSMTTELTLD